MDILVRGEYTDLKHPVKYLIKEDKHQGTGVNFLFSSNVTTLLNKYQNGSLCGKIRGKGY